MTVEYEVVVTPIRVAAGRGPVVTGRRLVVEATTPEHAERRAQRAVGPLMAVHVVPLEVWV